MKGNLNLGSVSGIRINIHWTFFFLIVWIVFEEIKQGGTTESILFNIAFVLAVFVCVVLHELGHALTAKRFGINTKKITLLPIGGVASLERIPEKPKDELLITIAGPLVNVVIGVILYFVIPVRSITAQNLTEALESLDNFTLQNFLLYLFVVNVGLVLFNIIPAFPMDGGRIFRALLAMKINRVKATQIASRVGQFIAVIFLLLGLLFNPFLIFIALFVFLGAYGENLLVQHLAIVEGFKVRDAMLTDITKLSINNTMAEVIEILLAGSENNFIVMNGDTIAGILYHEEIMNNSKNRTTTVKDIMVTKFTAINIDQDLKKIYRLVYAGKKSFFPVVDKNKLVGAIDSENLNEFILLQSKLAY